MWIYIYIYITRIYDVPKLSAQCVCVRTVKLMIILIFFVITQKTKRTAVRQVSDTNTAAPGMCIPGTTRDQVPGIRCNQVSGHTT